MDSSVDAERFRAALAVATSLTDPEERAAQLDRVLALWRGRAGVVDGVTGGVDVVEWLGAAEARWSTEIDCGRPGNAIRPLTALVAEHPHREDLLTLLIRALYRAGRPGDALEAFRQGRARLVGEFGLEPGRDLHRLQEAVLRGDPDPLPAASPADPVPADPARPARFPAPPRSFVGREWALAELDTLRGGTIGVINGPAGVGKTALAVRWAAHARHRFPDGRLFLDLRGDSPGTPLTVPEALSRLLRDLGTPPGRVPAGTDEAVAAYRARTAGCRMLLVLDNAADAAQVRPLLPGGPRSVVVVTGRDRSGGLAAIEGAHRIALPPLTRAEAGQLLGHRDTLIGACGGMPLALHIAAAAPPGHPAPGDARDPVAHAFRFTYDRLDPTAAATLRMLALAPDGVVTPAVAAILTGRPEPDTIACLGVLTDAHLLERHGDEWRMHDLVAGYARERLVDEVPEPERTEAAARLLDWHLTTPDIGDRRIGLDIYRAGPVAAQRRGETRRLGLLLNELAVALIAADERTEARQHLNRALALHRRHGDLTAEGSALVALGRLQVAAGEHAEAMATLEAALAAAPDRAETAHLRRLLGA
ncbi:BTAD domain-containing putative transcriptional regulator [Actinoplanes sp. NBRC 103695]|uniref:BTAD domain-containing putative transcriptional regulator n=1 Tax=Actinoplanes sp. NBRC 103695 TaxID=3032202 RepID=UPI0025532644|nr:BTAD domain-containing putative transcriptional regulator [Actinoplanes sp. NBRC 103695]